MIHFLLWWYFSISHRVITLIHYQTCKAEYHSLSRQRITLVPVALVLIGSILSNDDYHIFVKGPMGSVPHIEPRLGEGEADIQCITVTVRCERSPTQAIPMHVIFIIKFDRSLTATITQFKLVAGLWGLCLYTTLHFIQEMKSSFIRVLQRAIT